LLMDLGVSRQDFTMDEKNAGVMASIQETLRSMDLRKPTLSTLAQKGDGELVEKFMTENISFGKEDTETAQSQLYMASFWGLPDVIKVLIESGADPNISNKNTHWTPLHAAAFQEHGKVIMMLLEAGADPEAEDLWGRTPKDFASASDKVWSFFAANGCQRTTKQALMEKRVLQKKPDECRTAADYSQGRKSTASSLLRFDDEETAPGHNSANAYTAAVNGDVLAGSNEQSMAGGLKQKQDKNTEQPSFSAWRS